MSQIDVSKNSHLRLVVFAHVPPPLHGQSVMVLSLLDALKKKEASAFECVHIDARFSAEGKDVGSLQVTKSFRLAKYLFQALCAWRPGAVLYYVPGPVKTSALLRDWIVLGCLRLVYRRVVFHWHAVGLGAWAEKESTAWTGKLARWLTSVTHGGVDVSIVLSTTQEADAGVFRPKAIKVVNNGIPNPCPGFDNVLADRQSRLAERLLKLKAGSTNDALKPVIRVLFFGTCLEEKGVFDALEAVRKAAHAIPEWDWELLIAGEFPHSTDHEKMLQYAQSAEAEGITVRVLGMVVGEEKRALFERADCFLFPTFYAAEGQPLVVVEALAWGLPIVSTRWRDIPAMLSPQCSGLAEPRDCDSLASQLLELLKRDVFLEAREHYLNHYQVESFQANMVSCFEELGLKRKAD